MNDTTMNRQSRKPAAGTTMLILAAVFAAITAVCSQIVIPLAPVPINLATFAIFITAGFLGLKYGTLSAAVYVLLGAIGAPVFAGFTGGAGIIAGPTGGYIIGYIVCAAVSAFMMDRLCGNGYTYPKIAVSLVCGLFFCYLLGTIWFYILSGWAIGKVLMACVIVFLPGDALKIAAACLMIRRLRPVVERYM